ncbi:MAG: Mur ligase family protein [Patescibacteria group bacterium]|nr:Mur ligase family protein [Patescibacteria group bacterium]
MKQCRSQKILLIDKQYLPDHASYILKATIKPRDIVLKSPGISPLSQDFQVIQDTGASMSTATQLFLAMYRNQIIGVTGSKGKSTTSSLIYSILQQTTDNVYLVGNIGISPLQVLVDHTDSIDHTTIFVYELSSYQLHGLTTSPKYAVITSLFPDHLDWHGGKDPYYADKLNILRFQDYKSGDWCFISHQARGVMQNSVILDSDRGSRIFIQDRILPLLQNLQI